MVERHLAKVNVVGSNPISRSTPRRAGRMMKKIVLIPALLFLLLSAPARAEKDLSQDQVAAYVAVVKADLARDGGAVAEARKHYQDALDLYLAIARNDPKWHPDIVQFRIAYCRSQLEALKGRAEGERVSPDAPAPVGAPDAATAEALQRLIELETENAALRARVEALTQEVTDLTAARDQMASEHAEARKKLEDALAELEAKHAALGAEKAELATKLDDALALLNDTDAGDPRNEIAPLREALEAAARELDAAREAALKKLQSAGTSK